MFPAEQATDHCRPPTVGLVCLIGYLPMHFLGTVLRFLDCINRHDADRLAELTSTDRAFLDSLGAVRVRDATRCSWRHHDGPITTRMLCKEPDP
jgi:hypothetical protein